MTSPVTRLELAIRAVVDPCGECGHDFSEHDEDGPCQLCNDCCEWENEDGPGGATNTSRSLTHSLERPRRG